MYLKPITTMKPQIFIDMALKAWDIQIGRTDKFFSGLDSEGLKAEVAPGKNRVVYLLGHLIAVNDNMIALYGKGERSYAHLDDAFVNSPDKSKSLPDANELLTHWRKSNEQLKAMFSKMTPEDWFSKHSLMTDEDLQKEPSRNKLSVLLTRTNHVAYHLGQLVLASKAADAG
jgi:hypothetical protein